MLKLNLLQKKVLKLLSLNCRYTATEIASVTHASVPAVQYTIEQLFDTKKVGQPVAIFNGRPFGYRIFYIFFKCKHGIVNVEKILSHKSVIAAIKTFGRWDAQIIIHAKNTKDASLYLQELELELESVVNYQMHEHLDDIKWNYALSEYDVDVKIPKASRNITRSLARPNIISDYVFANDLPDATDKEIIKTLLKKPMENYANIALKANTNHETVRYRIKRMIEKNWIQGFTVTPSFAAFGYFSYIVLIKTKQFDSKQFTEHILTSKNIWYAANIAGSHNFALYIGERSPPDLTKTISELKLLLKDSLIDIEFLLFEKEEYNDQFPHELLPQ